MTAHEILIQYEGRLQELQAGLAHVRVQHVATATTLIVAATLFLALGFYAVQQRLPFWWPSLPIPIAAASARLYRRLSLARSQMARLQGFYHRAVDRIKGMWPGQGFTGDEFNRPGHVYAKDLSVFGEGSLFELLCIARTAIGRRGLASYLLEAPTLAETLTRQEAVRELQPRSDLREKIALLGEFEFSESRSETFTDWLNSPPVSFPRSLRVIAAMTSTLVLAVVLAGAAGLLPWIRVAILISPLILFHSLAGLILRGRVNRMIESLRTASLETRVLREGLQLLETQRFQSAKLIQIARQVRHGSAAVRKLERLLDALNERNKDWFYQASLLLLVGTQLCMAIERWRMQHGDALRAWIDAWGEFEALNSLATYAHENPDNAFPEFSAEEPRLEAIALGHPLLPDQSCVRNDVSLNGKTRFFVISGSNMSGKSSLLRAIGLNAVLASAGAPVRAQALRLSQLSVCASLSVVDSLLNGKSKFLAEVDRVRQTIQMAASRNVLFLIDEIFSGTNSSDRRTAAEAVVRTLVGRGAIGALSTHDISLTEIADAEGLNGANLHLGAKNGDDPMHFDYLLKPGVTRETNALAIARMAGVPV